MTFTDAGMACQSTPAIDVAIYHQIVHYINSSPVFIHNRRNCRFRAALRAEKNSTRSLAFMFVSFRLLVVESI